MVLSLQDTTDQLEEQKLNRGKLTFRESKNSQTEKSIDMLKIQIWLHSYMQGRTGQESESRYHPWLNCSWDIEVQKNDNRELKSG